MGSGVCLYIPNDHSNNKATTKNRVWHNSRNNNYLFTVTPKIIVISEGATTEQ